MDICVRQYGHLILRERVLVTIFLATFPPPSFRNFLKSLTLFTFHNSRIISFKKMLAQFPSPLARPLLAMFSKWRPLCVIPSAKERQLARYGKLACARMISKIEYGPMWAEKKRCHSKQ